MLPVETYPLNDALSDPSTLGRLILCQGRGQATLTGNSPLVGYSVWPERHCIVRNERSRLISNKVMRTEGCCYSGRVDKATMIGYREEKHEKRLRTCRLGGAQDNT
jgi:hypothetical protein